ncbi:Aldehyde Dehydrogenase OS=Tsukamurella paurometabola (strain ATCC 8368 / DSM / CCUG 35730 /CIP 100753 / JCM 10117 / KCTC 9821 / NBRC 16120 / NCIMB 702349/ NCTC 13040) OX=521096 GN=Tpau_3952 PE=3 SV=1 [Tsukamurella paurometabola]|uniref:Aldehyde Dehydrogenase n=1 Tax=Tsukamurella paurometabola (strain ATCC 8368 / DSM 20162 / CCUG 35730 / CIP 100753 / JCM 10117 / KCTC 9821 / NBRC 16120 / NCIMB 702349 / NCTC 13040) TaxID=521096 RepID=D5UMQ0_TSUPD|nr:aldehyde dehydrogenase family protein [Tsukamurella paurometabola]ADG80524.1 Aldehyde Dehydrogenase [Tsukamurella paurometabola DSM 20162]SUP39963.1 Succinate-semialdehyde dehydrogenase [NADP(+)] GabD [Tsukamurella paurometabola]
MTTQAEPQVTYRMSIDGQARESSSGEVIEVRDKFDGALLGTIPAGTAEDAQEALDAAPDGARAWAATPAHRRAAVLKAAAAQVRVDRDVLSAMLSAENGKTIANARLEIDTTARILEGFAEEGLRLFGQTVPLDIQEGLESDLMLTVREPLGVMVGIVPFNFPAELYAHKVGAALAAGNAMIVKPPEDDPIVTMMLTEILHRAGVPHAALQVVTGYGHIVGQHLSSSPDIAAVTFTGSTEVGAIIAANAGRNIVRAFLELSGNDAFIVCDDADLDAAVEQAIAGRVYANGQVCVATKRIMVVRSRYDEFLERLRVRVAALRTGDQRDEATDVGPLISVAAARTVEAQIAASVEQGARLLVGGTRDGAFIAPALLEIDTRVGIATDEEIFGPVFSVLSVGDLDEAIDLANASRFGLNAAVFTSDVTRAIQAGRRIQAGIVSINGGNAYRPDVAAFGGYKKSGIGREGLGYTLDEFSQVKSIVLRGVLNS